MKMEINIKITNDDGQEMVTPVLINTEIPDFDEYIDSSNFREVFNKCEQSVLKIRNKSTELAIEEYLTELSKKKQIQKQIQTKMLKYWKMTKNMK
jgi:hypothetical protein